MKSIKFYKYQGTGNDFIILDQLEGCYDLTQKEIGLLCHRRFGIGADGLMYLRKHETLDYEMIYFNSDGNPSTMCGNGGRCITHLYAKLNGIADSDVTFLAVDGPHQAKVLDRDIISLKMKDVSHIKAENGAMVLDTGSPHFVIEMPAINKVDVKARGAEIRYSDAYMTEGINVNFMTLHENNIQVRTYERGVEDETLSCGTGVTASALVADLLSGGKYGEEIHILTLGGELSVSFLRNDKNYTNVWLTGPAKMVFKGEIKL